MDAIFEAVLQGEREVARLLRAAPGSYGARMAHDQLVDAILIGSTWAIRASTWRRRPSAPARRGSCFVPARIRMRRIAAAPPRYYACDPRPRSAVPWSRESQARLIRLLVDMARISTGRIVEGPPHPSGRARAKPPARWASCWRSARASSLPARPARFDAAAPRGPVNRRAAEPQGRSTNNWRSSAFCSSTAPIQPPPTRPATPREWTEERAPAGPPSSGRTA